MSTKIYTKTGDLGKTSLIGGTKVSKSNIRISKYPYDGVFLRIGKRGVRQIEKLGF